MATYVYGILKGLKTVDIIFGLLYILFAAAAIFVRFQLSGFKAKAPAFYLGFIGAIGIVNILYLISAKIVISQATSLSFSASGSLSLNGTTIGSIIGNVVLLVVNIIYFKNRKHLFIN